MKKIGCFLLMWVAFSANGQTKAEPIVDQDFDDASLAATEYVEQMVSEKNLNAYLDIDQAYSKTIVNGDLKTFAGSNVQPGDVLGYVVEFRLKPKYLYGSRSKIGFRIFVNPNLEAWFDKGWESDSPQPQALSFAEKNGLLDQQHTLMYIGALNVYLVAISNNSILTKDKILHLAAESDPGKSWNVPQLVQKNGPDYSIYWELTESGCNECESLHIRVDDDIILETVTVHVD